MPEVPNKTVINAVIPDLDRGSAQQQQLMDLVSRKEFRTGSLEVIKEYVGSVEFMKTVQEYASEEFDKRIYRSAKFWLTSLAVAAGSGIIGALISKAVG